MPGPESNSGPGIFVSQEADVKLEQIYSWRGRTVAWDSVGSGPPIVACHGTPWSSQLWAPIARALSADFTVYLWDMPGYGQSSMSPEHAVDLGVQGELFANLLAHWNLEDPHVVAHDYGGAVALRAHLLHGASYASLALVDVVALRPWGSDSSRTTTPCSPPNRPPCTGARSRRTSRGQATTGSEPINWECWSTRGRRRPDR